MGEHTGDPVFLPQQRSSRGNPIRDSDVLLARVGTDVADAPAWIEAHVILLPRAGREPMTLILHMHLPRLVTVASLGFGLVAFGGVAFAQESGTINADGSSGASHAGLNPAVDADGPTLIYGDIPGGTVIDAPVDGSAPVSKDVVYAPPPGTVGDITATNGDAAALGPTGDASAAPGSVTGGSGTALLGPDGTYTVTEISPSDVTVGDSGDLAPAPVYDTGVEPAPEYVAEPVETTELVASDADADGVADNDEATLYGTDPYVWDTDDDGLSDGEELFASGTDPLVWDTDGDGVSDGEEVAAGSDPFDPASVPVRADAAPGPEGAAAETLRLDSDNDRLADADEAALGTDPTNPDTDGDGYYDGDEVNLGTDPFDPASHP